MTTVRESVSFCHELVSATLGDPTSATTVPADVRSRSLTWIGLPTDEADPALTHTSAL